MPISRRRSSPVPYWVSDCGRATVYVGDNLQAMLHLESEQFHAIITDPPYGLEFMGEEWDAPWKNKGKIETCDEGTDKSYPFRDGTQRVVYGNKVNARQRRADELSDPIKAKYLRHNVEYVRDSLLYQQWFFDRAAQMLRLARPGAHLLSFGGTRMWHRTACAIEDAGFEIRDMIMWVYSQGFPKGRDISKAIDKMMGAERGKVDQMTDRRDDGTVYGIGHSGRLTSDAPITDAARQWDGWNTALKPAVEPIVVARKQPRGSVAQNVMDHGCGGLNVDGCRVGATGGSRAILGSSPDYLNNVYGEGMGGNPKDKDYVAGRWPANVILDEEAARLLDEQSGERKSSGIFNATDHGPNSIPKATAFPAPGVPGTMYADTGGASRFFKSFPQEIDECHSTSLVSGAELGERDSSRVYYAAKADDSDRPHGRKGANAHPTVKPLDLMRYLVRLACARGGTVFDPFMGSGSTGCAAIEEGMWFVGMEQSQEYADIAVGRLRLSLEKCPTATRLETGEVARHIPDAPPPPRKLR